MHPWTTPFSLIGFTGAALGFGGTARTAVLVAETLFAISVALLLIVSLLGRVARLREGRVRKEANRHRRKPRNAHEPSRTDAAAEDGAFYVLQGLPRDLAGAQAVRVRISPVVTLRGNASVRP